MGKSNGKGLLYNLTALKWVVESGILNDLTMLETKALMVYLYHANNHTGDAYPSMQSVAKRICKGEKKRARVAVQGLVRRGILVPVGPGAGIKGTNVYRLARGATNAPPPGAEGEGAERSGGGASEARGGGVERPEGGAVGTPRTTQVTTHRTTHQTNSASGGESDCVATEKGRDHDADDHTAPSSTPVDDPLQGFEAHWEVYPEHRRTNKKGCQRLWMKHGLGDKQKRRAVWFGLAAWNKSDEWQKNDRQYVPLFFKFLEERRWEGAPQPKPKPRYDTNDIGELTFADDSLDYLFKGDA